MNRVKYAAILTLMVLSVSLPSSGRAGSVVSPSGEIELVFELRDGAPFYSVLFMGGTVISYSRMGMSMKEGPDLANGLMIVKERAGTADREWEQPWGQRRMVSERYNSLRAELKTASGGGTAMIIEFRVFDDGVGFRYELPTGSGPGDFVVMDEKTEFVMSGDDTAWWIPAFQDNRYEYLYTESRVKRISSVHTPLTIRTAGGIYMSIDEAALTDWASMTLLNRGDGVLECDLVPWSNGDRVRGARPAVSPWRTILIADEARELLTSTVILNLNEPCRIEDTSWIKPGKYVGIWWGMHIGRYTWSSGPHHGATTANTKRYIDFAAENGFDGVLVEGWNLGWDGNWFADGSHFQFTIPHPDFDIEEVCRYCAEKGVYLIGHHETGADIDNYERQLETAFEYYESLGVRAVKTGYVGHRTNEYEWHHGQYMVRHYRRVVETAARHRLMIIAHEPIKPTGIRRTWPNMISREGARGQEYNAWSGDGGNPPEHTTILPFTRMLGGPLDFTPGIFDLFFEKAGRPNNRVNTTLAKQLALYVVIYSPMQMAADLPENYEGKAAFQFIKDVPTDWEESVAIHGAVGDYVTFARKERGGEDWYIGSITDENGRTLNAGLGFLDEGREYEATIYADGHGADWRTAPLKIDITTVIVDSSTDLEMKLAPGGGQAIRIRPLSPR